jgi:tRNA U38,U39,U40 pseudouridine synthase TruA
MVQLRHLGADDYVFRIRGDRFLYKMVRNIVGALVKVGHGQIQEGEIAEALEAGAFSRSASLALTAPPQGLVLRHVLFGGTAAATTPAFSLGQSGGSTALRRAGLRQWRAPTVRGAAT